MDQSRFDSLIKGLASATTRRRALSGLAGGAAAIAGLGRLTALDADAKGNCNGKNKKRCGGKCVRIKKSAKNCGQCHRACPSGEVCSHGLTCQDKSCFPVTETEGNVELSPDGGLTLHADTSGQYGSFDFEVPAGTTFAQLATMETDFAFTDGSVCGATSPRFALSFQGVAGYLVTQIPPDMCATPNESGNSGNLIGNNTPYVWTSYGGDPDPNVTTYDQALAAFGDDVIKDLFVVLDSSNGETQTVTLKPCVKISTK